MDGQIVINTKLNDKPLTDGIKNIEGVSIKALGAVKKALAAVGLTVGVTALVKQVNSLVKSSAELTDRIDKQSQKIGMSKRGYQEWDYILSQNGANVDGLQLSMKTLSTVVDEAEQGNKTYAATLARLGVETRDLNGKTKSQEVLFSEVFTALTKVESQTERTALASRLLGRSATELAPALNGGADSVEELRARAHELGLVLDDTTINAGVRLTDAMDDAKRAMQSAVARGFTPLLEHSEDVQMFIAEKLAPALETFVSKAMAILPKVKAIGEFIVEVFSIVAKYTKMALSDAFGFLQKSVFEPFMAWLIDLWQTHGTTLIETVGIIWSAVDSIIDYSLDQIKTIIEIFGKALSGDWAGVWEGVQEIVARFADFFPDILDKAFTIVTNLLGVAYGAIADLFEGMFGKSASDLVWALHDSVLEGFTFIKEGILLVVQALGQAFAGDWEGVWETAKELFTKAWEAILSNAERLVGAVFALFGVDFEQVIERAKALPAELVQSFRKMKDDAIRYVAEMVESIQVWFSDTKLGKAFSWVGEKTEQVTGFFRDMWDKVTGHSYVPDMVEEIGEAFSKLWDKMVEPAKEATGAVSQEFEGLAGQVGRAVDRIDFFGGIAEGWRNFLADAKEEYKDWAGFVQKSLGGMLGTMQQGLGNGIQALTNLWVNQGSIIEELAQSIEDLSDSMERSLEDLEDAQDDYNRAVASGDSKAIKAAKRRLDDQQKVVRAQEQQLKALKDEKKSVEDGSKAWSQFGKVILEALANTLYGLGAELAARAVLAAVTFNWGGAALAGTASVAAFAAGALVDSWAGSFAEGGIVPQRAGVPSTGDQHIAGVNPGEVILNHAQQSNLAAQLTGGINVYIDAAYGLDSEEVGRAVYRNIKVLQTEGVLGRW